MESIVANPIFFIVGATGSGKSSLAVKLALHLRSSGRFKEIVIVNCDVMQFYKDLPIATNKGFCDESAGIPHVFQGFLNGDDSFCAPPESNFYVEEARGDLHMGCAPPPQTRFTVHTYLELVVQFIERFFRESSNGAVVVCGGTCYYLQSVLLDNMLVGNEDSDADACGGRDSSLSSEEADERTEANQLWERLNEIDPESAQRYHPNDTRRIRRLLEIHRQKGEKPSVLFEKRPPKLRFPPERTFVIWTWMDRCALNHRLRARVDEMVQRGLLSEVKDFRRETEALPQVGVISDAIGFREFADIPEERLEVANDDLVVAAIEKVKNDTVRYARKQERWLSNRVVTVLASLVPPLPLNHFVRADLGNAEDKNALVEDIVRTLFAISTDLPSSDSFALPLSSRSATRPTVSQAFCDSCQVVVYGRGQMEIHLQSKRHRGALKRLKLEKDQLERFGRVLPPRKRCREQ